MMQAKARLTLKAIQITKANIEKLLAAKQIEEARAEQRRLLWLQMGPEDREMVARDVSANYQWGEK